MATPQVWLITGASSGFGRAVTEFVLNQGDIAVATLRNPAVLQELSTCYSEDRLLVLKVDVTHRDDIDYAFRRTKEVFSRLDVVFNNAGYSIVGDAETTPIDTAEGLFDVNFWGAVNVSRAAVKFFREVNEPGLGGILLQNSFIAGLDGAPGLAFYSASKHEQIALNGFSESLAKEIPSQWNIKICIIDSGGFNTNALTNSVILPKNPVYDVEASALGAIWKVLDAHGVKLQGDPAKFARVIYSLVQCGAMPLHFPIGQDALTMARKKVELLERDISEATPWSVDLLHIDDSATLPA